MNRGRKSPKETSTKVTKREGEKFGDTASVAAATFALEKANFRVH